MNRSKTLYPSNAERIITIFDVSDAETAERLGKEIVAHRGRARLYALGLETYALFVRSYGAGDFGTSTIKGGWHGQ